MSARQAPFLIVRSAALPLLTMIVRRVDFSNGSSDEGSCAWVISNKILFVAVVIADIIADYHLCFGGKIESGIARHSLCRPPGSRQVRVQSTQASVT